MKTIITITTLVVICLIAFVSCSTFGTSPKKEKVSSFKALPNFDNEKEVFKNVHQDQMDAQREKAFNWKVIKKWFESDKSRVPQYKLPEVKPNMIEFLKSSEELKVMWFGHSSFLLNMNGVIILVDPVFSGSASPFSFMVKRFQKPILKLDELPSIDIVLISHDHYDHLDMKSIKYFSTKDVLFLTPKGVGSHLEGWGVDPKRIVEKNWWDSYKHDSITFTATPSQHFSGRGPFDTNKTLWASWVLKSNDKSIYFSGDSGYSEHFKEIGDRLGPFDLAFIESGQYNESWKLVHLMPDQFVKAFTDLRAKRYFPIHWGMFELAMHSWNEPIKILSEYNESYNLGLTVPKIGEVYILNSDYQLDQWWLRVGDNK